MKFSEVALQLREERLKLPKDGVPYAGIQQRDCYFLLDNEDICLVGSGQLIYADIDPEGSSSDAQIVKAGTWKNYECGYLCVIIQDTVYDLARVNPEESVDIRRGWITTKGDVIIKEDIDNDDEIPDTTI